MVKKHIIEECPQAPTLAVHGAMMVAHRETLDRLDMNYTRVAVALETLAARGAQVDSIEKRVDIHKEQIQIAFNQIREVDKRVTYLEIKESEWEGEDKAEENAKKEGLIWTKLQKGTIFLQVLTPVVLGLFFILWMADTYGVFRFIAKNLKEMTGK